MKQNKNKTSLGSAPGKIILFGEHAVVYNQPAIAIPVLDIRAQAEISPTDEAVVQIHSNDIQLNTSFDAMDKQDPIRKVIELILIKLSIRQPKFNLLIKSDIPVAAGLGSGAAVSVAVVKAICKFYGHTIPLTSINEIAYEVEKIHHGTPSGIDNTTITYETPIFYQKNHPVEFLMPKGTYSFVIANTGIQIKTKDIVDAVRQRFEYEPQRYQAIFDDIGQLCFSAKQKFCEADYHGIGELMNENQSLLKNMGVSSQILEEFVGFARDAGALGAKLSGAGVGGNMIALVTDESKKKVREALIKAGATHTLITTLEGKNE